MTTTNCFGCHATIEVQKDEWWSHSWEENPAEETVDEAIEAGDDFRDWFRKNIVLCPDCHKRLVEELRAIQSENDLRDEAPMDLQADSEEA